MEEAVFKFSDDLGPAKIVHVWEPTVGLKGTLVVDNVALGPSIGGLRMAPDVSTEECFRLARAMTLKNSAAGLDHGGGKSVLYGDPKMPVEQKEQLIRAMACALKNIEEYIFGPDMGTNEVCMAWVKEEIGRSVGLPREAGGIPLDEIGATAWGINHVADIAARYCKFSLQGARVVIQGFGAVGKHAARFLRDQGTLLVAVADSGGAIHSPQGLDVDELIRTKEAGHSVTDHPEGEKLDADGILDVECEIWIPAARPDVIKESNVGRLKTRVVIPGANIALTLEAEKTLHSRGVLCLPDFIANAGGVICAAMEYQGASEAAAMGAIEEKVRQNTEAVLAETDRQQITPREAATILAVERVQAAMALRRWSIF